MSSRLPLLVGILVGGILLGGCDGGSTPMTPTAQTPPAPAPPPPPPPPPPQEPAALASLTLNPSTVPSQGSSEATVTLTAAAPAGNAVVELSSGNPVAARVPSNISVAAGATSATFRIDTSTVSTTTVVNIVAMYAGVRRDAELTVQPPALEARFTVTSPGRGTDACDIVTIAGAVDCQFNASGSTGFVARYLWTMRVGNTTVSFSGGDDQQVVSPVTDCGFLGNGTAEDGKVPMEVTLQLEDRSGNRSSTARRTISVHHNSRCGY